MASRPPRRFSTPDPPSAASARARERAAEREKARSGGSGGRGGGGRGSSGGGRGGRGGGGPRRPRIRGPRNDFAARLIAAIPAILFAIFIVYEGGLIFAIGVIALGIVCLHELYSMLRATRPVKLLGFIAVVALALTALYGDTADILLVTVATIPAVFLLVIPRNDRTDVTISMAITLLGTFWIGLAIAHAVLLRETPHGDGILVDILVGTFLGDTGAYFGGRMFGQRPLAQRISPNKTLEGLVAGFFTAIIATWFAGLYQDWLSGPDALLLGLGVAIAAPLGDLFESMIKRDAATKDTGRMFGAHGGALDRLDAVLFSIPVGYYIWLAIM
jgi:phosphatidate cytidylyltransferase